MIEFSAPNTNKPQHLGHVRNNLLGDALAKILSAAGFKVVKANLVNDRGIHVAKSMLAYKLWGEGKTPQSEKVKSDHFVGDFYLLFGKKEKDDPSLLDKAQELVRKWEAGDSETLALWQRMNKWAIAGLKETYQKLGISFDKWYWESETYKLGKEFISKALKKGLCYRRDDGAVEIDLTAHGLDKKVLIRPDGTSVYVTQDLGLAKLKFDEFKLDKSIYVVGSEQDYHFKMLFKVLELFGFKWAKKCWHLSYGMVWLPEGRMKSREGQVVEADDIIHEMKKLAQSEILARDANISGQDLRERAGQIGLAALKFYLLKFTPQQALTFNPEESISFEGATGPYVQYAYARIQSIKKKFPISPLGRAQRAGGNFQFPKEVDYSVLGNQEEVALLKLLDQFPEEVAKSARDYNPARTATYLLNLAQMFNKFYHAHPVLQAKTEELKVVRLALINSVAIVLKNGLALLGIATPEKM
jgi:arginyl-tRNA synthetase